VKCDKCGYDLNTGHRCIKCGASLIQKPETNRIVAGPAIDPPLQNGGAAKVAPGGFWNFDVLITKIYIKVIFILGCILIGIMSLGAIVFAAIGNGFIGFVVGAIVAVIGGAVSFLVLRLACEALIIFFKIHEEIKKLNEK